MTSVSNSAIRQFYASPWLMPLALLACAGIILLTGWINAQQQRTVIDVGIRRQLLKNAVDVAESIDLTTARRLSFTPADADRPAYMHIRDRLTAFSEVLPHSNVYTMRLRDGRLHFGPESYSPMNELASPPGDVYEQPPPQAFAVFEDKRPVVFGPHRDEFGSFLTALAPALDPVSDEIVLVVGLEIQESDWLNALRAAQRPVFLRTGTLAILLLACCLLLWARRSGRYRAAERWPHLERALLIALGVALSWAFSGAITGSEQRERDLVFSHIAEMHADLIRETLHTVDIQLALVSGFFEASEFVTEAEFGHFTAPFFNQIPISALGWIPQGDTDAAPLYTLYVQPPDDPLGLLALDHAAQPELAHAIRQTLYSHQHPASALTLWPDDGGDRRPYYFYYRTVGEPTRHEVPVPSPQRGTVFAAIQLQHVLDNAMRRLAFESAYVDLRVVDIESNYAEAVAVHPEATSPHTPSLSPRASLNFAVPGFGRMFQIVASPTPEFLNAYPVRSGRIIGLAGLLLTAFIATFVSVIHKRQHEIDIEQSETKYRRLFNAMTSGFALHELIRGKNGEPVDYRFIEVNEAFERHTGMKADQVVGRTLYEVMPHADPTWLARYAPVALNGTSIRFEHYVPDLNRHFDILAYSPEKGRFAILVTDITPRKRVEEQLARNEVLQRVLTDMATRFINLPSDKIDEATQAVLEEVGRFTGADRAYQFLYDFDQRIMTNTHEWCAQGIPPEIDHLQALPFDVDPDLVVTHVTGKPYYVRDTSLLPADLPLRSSLEAQHICSLITIPLMSGSECLGFIGFDSVRQLRTWTEEEINLLRILSQLLSNAHQRKQAEKKQAQLERQILHAQKLESLGVMAGGIAHDFNNLLTTILGNAELAQRDVKPDSSVHEALTDIATGARRAAELCRQMLAYAGKGRFTIEPCSLNTLIEEMIQLVKTSISKRARVELHLQPDLPLIYGDASQIRQIILNLTINASEALEDTSGHITLRTGTQYCTKATFARSPLDQHLPDGTYVTLEVVDTGCGMDLQTLSRIFDPFFTTKFAGRGLGLSAVMGIVRSHKGALHVDSVPGQGTTFQLYLPAAEEDADTPPAPVAQAATPLSEWQGGGTILLADDEPTVRSVGQRIFERMGLHVITAQNGMEALTAFDAHRDEIRVVLLDLTMPHMSGTETFEALRERDTRVPVILTSGYSEDALSELPEGLCPTAFVQKPFDEETLRALLHRLFTEEWPGDRDGA